MPVTSRSSLHACHVTPITSRLSRHATLVRSDSRAVDIVDRAVTPGAKEGSAYPTSLLSGIFTHSNIFWSESKKVQVSSRRLSESPHTLRRAYKCSKCGTFSLGWVGDGMSHLTLNRPFTVVHGGSPQLQEPSSSRNRSGTCGAKDSKKAEDNVEIGNKIKTLTPCILVTNDFWTKKS
ncbi:hypothetical protein NQ318_014180 [Aromia moschata]|uniref:Uncharacterized protein n=1 Tax=Aromia moschata TaxID=1265417 RepID=A0AAV8Y8G9_9CUCU|nr:hypothetical protein NQ318_014180 [Aromia moschata]